MTSRRGRARVQLAIALTLIAGNGPAAAQGLVDQDFKPSVGGGSVFALAVQPDGKILIGGDFTVVNGQPHAYIARLTPEGAIDPNFNVTNITLASAVWALALQPGREDSGWY